MRKSLLYTATGDKGTTSLVGGTRVEKDCVRIEAYGTVDELNSYVGLVASLAEGVAPDAAEFLLGVQHRLFDIGAALATPSPDGATASVGIDSESVKRIEEAIDSLDARLPRLSSFILPGGSVASSHAQVARTVCRRAERRIVALARVEPVQSLIIVYINRLSDYLFALARYLNVAAETSEILWRKDCL